MARSDIYDDRSFEDQYLRELLAIEKDLQQYIEPREKRQLQVARSTRKRQLALWKRLYGGTLRFQFIGPLELFPVPRNWRSGKRPQEPFPELGIDAVISALIGKNRIRPEIFLFCNCPYWCVRWAIYNRFDRVERAFYSYVERREIAARIKRVEALSTRAQEIIIKLATALRDCSDVDLGLSQSEQSVPFPSERTRTGNDEYVYNDEMLFDWTELEIPSIHLGLLSDQAEYLYSIKQYKGDRKLIRRYSFGLAIGAMWWELTGNRPTKENTDLGDFISAAETVFFHKTDPASDTPETFNRLFDRSVEAVQEQISGLFHNVEIDDKVKLHSAFRSCYRSRIAAAEAKFKAQV